MAAYFGAVATLSPLTPRADAAFPARNGRIVFAVSEVEENRAFEGNVESELYSVSPSGHDLRRLTQTPGSPEFQPRWSPDGRLLTFSRVDPVANRGLTFDVYVMDAADPSSATRLSDSPLGNDDWPEWSPDGKRIAFGRDSFPASVRTGTSSEIFVMDSDGGDVTQLTDGPNDSSQPVWSPDGETIAYVYNAGSIRLIRPDGSGNEILATGDGPSWSPNAKSLAFHSQGDIFVVDVNSRGSLRNLTVAHSEASDQDPAWSPDGKWIAFVSDRDGGFKLYRMRPDGSDVTKIVDITIGATQSGIDWGPRPSG